MAEGGTDSDSEYEQAENGTEESEEVLPVYIFHFRYCVCDIV